ncbi:hypothetical protein FISHEDRAFT_60746 [Fistulina hepatica ATCC 64428]|uniref:Fork-head domain-containing protein n=1 Tax=Fistulina hepatica ATCC 64428 TaxID=1128425 RepID=A0A0D7A5B3_9AGAR|nr:hypothetical protein FISHEDRAFT_60746 [Fistulina hepatica ATCC 64428]
MAAIQEEHAPDTSKVEPDSVPEKISAYYSLVFPRYTFYVRTLSVSIGRRCNFAGASSTEEPAPVDVDLGSLKSVSRLHAKIEYDQEEDRFFLVVIGRNGAWVDGVWSRSGTRAPLGERSQIQIASRTFHFVLPPPPPPEDTPTPSTENSRPRSPSVDVTSYSPPSSLPSRSPPPPKEVAATVPPPPPKLSVFKTVSKSTTSKKRKKGGTAQEAKPRPKPEDMPPKPQLTYVQLIYRALKGIGHKATLQEIYTWIMNTYEYYQYSDTTWMTSVRHNLSLSPAFKKLERCGGDRGKGFFWCVDEEYEPTLLQQEAKQEMKAEGAKKKGKNNPPSEPALKRSVKAEPKPDVIPHPAPEASATAPAKAPSPSTRQHPSMISGNFAYAYPHLMQGYLPGMSYQGISQQQWSMAQQKLASTLDVSTGQPIIPSSTLTSALSATSAQSHASSSHPMTAPQPVVAAQPIVLQAATSPPASTSLAAIPTSTTSATPQSHVSPPVITSTITSSHTAGDVFIPIVRGPIPPTHADYAPGHPNNSAKRGYMVLHERTLIIDPEIFSDLSPEMLRNLEKTGARRALPLLTAHMVKVLKERRRKKNGKEKSGGGKDRPSKRPKTVQAARATAPFTRTPLVRGTMTHAIQPIDVSIIPSDDTQPLAAPIPKHDPLIAIPLPPDPPGNADTLHDPGTPIVVVDDSDDELSKSAPPTKRLKVEHRVDVASV